MKTAALLLGIAFQAAAQIQTVNVGSDYLDTQFLPKLDSNFAYLDAKVLVRTGVPNITCTSAIAGTIWMRIDASAPYASQFNCSQNGVSTWAWEASPTPGVVNFNGRSGAISLLSADVTGALGFSPVNPASLQPIATSGSANDLNTGTVPIARLPAITGGDIAASAGSVNHTVTSVGGSSASAVHNAAVFASSATSTNSPNTGIVRDGSGNFAATTFTGNVIGNLTGTASLASAFATLPTPCATGRYTTAIDVYGNAVCGQVQFAQLYGSIIPAQIPAPTPTTFGGVLSRAFSAHYFVSSVGLDGSIGTSQPSCSDLLGVAPSCATDATNASNINAGTLGVARLPAISGGDVSAPSGSASHTVNSVGGSSASNIHAAEQMANNATNSNTTNSLIKTDSTGAISPNLNGAALISAAVEILNVGTGGTAANTFVKLDPSASSQVVSTLTGDTTWHGVAMASASSPGTVKVARLGITQALADGPWTQGNAAILSATTAGYAHDAGNTRNSQPTSNSVGTFMNSCSSACAGALSTIEITPAERGTLISNANAAGIGKMSRLYDGNSLANKLVVEVGDSTSYNATTRHAVEAQNVIQGGSLAGLSVRNDVAFVTASGSTVTVTATNPLGTDVTVASAGKGGWIYFTPQTGATPCEGVGQVSSATTYSFTFTNLVRTCTASALATTGYFSRGLVYDGNNGQTVQNIITNMSSTSTGLGGVIAQNPDVVVLRAGINSVRQGAESAAQLQADYQQFWETAHSQLPKAEMWHKIQNTLLTVDDGNHSVVPVATTETLVDGSASGVTGTGSHVVTLAAMPTSLYMPSAVCGWCAAAQVYINFGLPDQETVTLTALTANTFTGVFAQTHTQGFSVIATQATAAQAYSTIIRQAGLGLVGKYPWLSVWDLQETIYGTVALAANPNCQGDQLHPAPGCQTLEGEMWDQILQRARPKSEGTLLPATVSFSTFGARAFNPYAAANARAANYSAPWTVYADACADPEYYTPVASGLANYNPAGSSFIQIGIGSNGSIQIGDVMQQESLGCTLQLPSSTTVINFVAGSSVRILGQTLPYVVQNGERITFWRAKYISPAAEALIKDRVTNKYVHPCGTGGGGAGYLDIGYPSSEGVLAAASSISTLDTLYFASGATLSLSGATFSPSGGNMRIFLSGSQTAYQNLACQIIGPQPMEGAPDVNGNLTQRTVQTVIDPTTAVGGVSSTGAGSASCSEPQQGTVKTAACYLNNYSQTAGNAHTYTFPAPFSTLPVVQMSGGSCGSYNPTVSASAVTFPVNSGMTGETCNLVIVGQ